MVINTLFLVVLLIFLVFIILGYIRGLFKSVFKLLAGVLAVALSYLLAPMIANVIINYTTLDDYINDFVETRIESVVRQTVENKVKTQLEESMGVPLSSIDSSMVENAVNAAMQTELTRNQQIEVINSISAPEFIRNALIENNQDSIKQNMGVDGFYEYISTYISYMIINALSFAITGVIINIILTLLSAVLSSALNLPIINNINRIGGMVFGFAQALLVVWIVFSIIGLGMSTVQGASLYNQIIDNQLLNYINEKNIINNVIVGLTKM